MSKVTASQVTAIIKPAASRGKPVAKTKLIAPKNKPPSVPKQLQLAQAAQKKICVKANTLKQSHFATVQQVPAKSALRTQTAEMKSTRCITRQ